METEEAKPFSQSSIYRFLNHSAERIPILNIRYDMPNDLRYSLNIAFTKVNDNQPGFWQKFKNMF